MKGWKVGEFRRAGIARVHDRGAQTASAMQHDGRASTVSAFDLVTPVTGEETKRAWVQVRQLDRRESLVTLLIDPQSLTVCRDVGGRARQLTLSGGKL